MGDFSRNPETRLSDARAKHYVGVRMQQGVPILDADWNESEDLRRTELETLGAWFIGNGVPSGSDGFHIVVVGQANNFLIRRGLCMVGGKVTENNIDVNYTTQPNFGNPALATPILPLTTPATDKQYIVYLDVWHREVESAEDPLMVDARIGIESTIRLKREWAVRVARVPEDLGLLASPPAGHLFYQLARLNRTAGNANITSIDDLRTTQLSVHQSIEVYNQANTLVVDTLRFKTMLENTQKNVFAFMKYITTQFNTSTMAMIYADALGLQAAARLISVAEGGLAVVNAGKMGNNGALTYLSQLYAAEDSFHIIWRDVMMQIAGGAGGKKYGTYQSFTTRLGDLLHLPLLNTFTGLQVALQQRNLEEAVDTQEEIARLFGAAAQAIARGSVLISLAKSPPGTLNAGQTARFEFRVRSFTTVADTFTVTILPADGWQRRVVDNTGTPIPGNRVPVGAYGSEATIIVDVVVGNGSSGLQLRVSADTNPSELTQTSGLYNLVQGQAPPQGEDKVQLNLVPQLFGGATLDANGVVNMTKNVAGGIVVKLTNATGVAANFTLSHVIQGAVGTWGVTISSPTTGAMNNGVSVDKGIDVNPGASADTMTLVINATASVQGTTYTGTISIPFKAT
jgi:hypothetical protein